MFSCPFLLYHQLSICCQFVFFIVIPHSSLEFSLSVILLNSIKEARFGIWIILSVLTEASYSKLLKDKVLFFLLLSLPGFLVQEVPSRFLLNWFKLMNMDYSEIIVSWFLNDLLPLQNFSMMSDLITTLNFYSSPIYFKAPS